MQNDLMMNAIFRAVLFDMDGLMLDTERLYFQVWRDAARRLGYSADDRLLLSFVGLSVEECEQRLHSAAGKDFPIDEFRALWPQIWKEHVAQHGIAVKEGLLPLLDWLQSRNISQAVVTSTPAQEAKASLRGAGLEGRFDLLVSDDHVAQSKPAPDIYLLAAERLGIPPVQCIALEDSEAGVLSAAAAEMRVVMVPDLRQPSAQARAVAYTVVASLHDVLPLLESWFQYPERG